MSSNAPVNAVPLCRGIQGLRHHHQLQPRQQHWDRRRFPLKEGRNERRQGRQCSVPSSAPPPSVVVVRPQQGRLAPSHLRGMTSSSTSRSGFTSRPMSCSLPHITLSYSGTTAFGGKEGEVVAAQRLARNGSRTPLPLPIEKRGTIAEERQKVRTKNSLPSPIQYKCEINADKNLR